MGPNKRNFQGNLGPYPLTLSDRSGAGGPGPGSPIPRGRGRAGGPIVYLARYASRFGKFFHDTEQQDQIFLGAFALQGNNFGPNLSGGPVGATALSHAIPKIFSRLQVYFK